MVAFRESLSHPGGIAPVMPSLQNVLSDNDRWNLINYICALTPHEQVVL